MKNHLPLLSINRLNLTRLWLLLTMAFVMSGCSSTLVAPYSPEVRMQLVRTSVQVEYFWQNMLDTPATERQFRHYKNQYQGILVDLKVLHMLNKMRPDNEESTKQAENLLTLWQQDMQSHQSKDSFKNFLLKRRLKEYQRVFTAMLNAEDAKDM